VKQLTKLTFLIVLTLFWAMNVFANGPHTFWIRTDEGGTAVKEIVKSKKINELFLTKYCLNRNDGTFELKPYLGEVGGNLLEGISGQPSASVPHISQYVNFQIIDTLPRPASGGPVVIGDSDHDSLMEIIYEKYQPGLFPLIVYEYNTGTQKFDSVWTIGDSLPIFDIGDIDGDNKTEVVTQYKYYIRVYESVDSVSYPSVLTWFHSLEYNIHFYGEIVDLDKDGKKEILTREYTSGLNYQIKIYECTADNQFDSVYVSPLFSSNGRNQAVGDFDQDGKMEFTAMDGTIIRVFENQGDNTYSEIWDYDWQQLNCQSAYGNDLDNDGLPEFIYGGNTGSDDHFAIFEKVVDDSFAISWDTIITGLGSGVLANMSTGNVSFGLEEELVLTAYDQWHVFRNIANDQYEDVYSYAFGVGHGLWGNTSVANVTGDDRDEIVAGSQYTEGLFVFKDMDIGIEEKEDPRPETVNLKLIAYPNPFTTSTTITFIHPSIGQSAKGIGLKIYDVSGRLVRSVPITTKAFTLGTDLSPGIYFLKFDDGKYSITEKVIKIR